MTIVPAEVAAATGVAGAAANAGAGGGVTGAATAGAGGGKGTAARRSTSCSYLMPSLSLYRL